MGNAKSKPNMKLITEESGFSEDETKSILEILKEKKIIEDINDNISEEKFKELFPIGQNKFMKTMFSNIVSVDNYYLNVKELFLFLSSSSRSSMKRQFKILLMFILPDSNNMTFNDNNLKEFFYLQYVFMNRLYEIPMPQDETYSRLIHSVRTDKLTSELITRDITFNELYTWISDYFPQLFHSFELYIKKSFFNSDISHQYYSPNIFSKSDILSNDDIYLLSMKGLTFQCDWMKLYSSNENGLSFPQLYEHIEGYDGSTLLLIKTEDNDIFGIYSPDMYLFKNSFYGSSSTFLLTLYPNIRFYHPSTLSGARYGGAIGSFRIWINDNMDDCYTSLGGLTYERGPLQSEKLKTKFNIHTIEVWGFGGEEAMNLLKTFKSIKEGDLMKNRQTDKSKLLGSDFDKEMFLGNTFKHEQEQQSRD
ncbi:hypothetical protein WA158_003122 [Blastocystis sp. Blastoise]